MKALSVLPPWWWMILHAGKNIENRVWSTNYRGPIYLHVGKRFEYSEITGDLLRIAREMPRVQLPAASDPLNPDPWIMSIRKSAGCIVGRVDIVGCVKQSDSPWFFGPYGFQLANPVAFQRPIRFTGSRGFFDVPDGIEC
jgi:hypothetical protein